MLTRAARCAGTSTYLTSLKPSARNYNSTTRWECGDEGQPLACSSEDIVRQIVYKLEQHCNSTFALGRAFKFFDRDNSSTIDVDEMRACLVTCAPARAPRPAGPSLAVAGSEAGPS